MPELPEVETTVRSLRREVLKRTFVRAWPQMLLEGMRIEDIYRQGKCIVFSLQDGKSLFVHLRMTGHFLVGKWKMVDGEWESEEEIMQDKRNKFLRFMFLFDDGKQLALSDQRKFADVRLLSSFELKNYLSSLGPDIMSLQKEEFKKMLHQKKREIKPLLMDQKFISGMGNIYAAEALHMAQIHPAKRSHLLSSVEAEKLHDCSLKVLKKSIELQGDSTSDYRLIDGTKGGYQEEHLVYNRKDCSCFTCGGKIKRIILGSRGSYYCPYCQKL